MANLTNSMIEDQHYYPLLGNILKDTNSSFPLALVILLAVFYASPSSSKQTTMHVRSWNHFFLSYDFKKCPKIHSQTELFLAYFSPEDKFFDREFVRQGIGFSLSDTTEWWLGGDYHFYNSTYLVRQESRIWYQILYKFPLIEKFQNIDDIALTSRSRLEQRKAENYGDISWRLRQQLHFTIPILNDACPNQYKAIFSDEIFFDLNHVEWLSRNFINQNRLFIGINRSISETTSISLGYLNQYIFGQDQDTMNHILYLTFQFN